MKTKVDMSITNEEFFKQSTCMYYTDEVQIKTIDNQKFVNEFQVCNSIGRGAYSKVKRVIRRSICQEDDDVELAEFAMKIMHKPSLKS